jgi:hypothetical protein
VARTKTKRRRSSFNPRSVVELRDALGRLIGKRRASRELLAKLVGSSPGSIYNWERGTAPNRMYIAKLDEIRQQVDAGELNLSGEPRPAAPASTNGRRKDGPTDATRSGGFHGVGAHPLYANTLVASGDRGKDGTTWLRFGVKRPGTSHTETLVELVVPTTLLKQLGR